MSSVQSVLAFINAKRDPIVFICNKFQCHAHTKLRDVVLLWAWGVPGTPPPLFDLGWSPHFLKLAGLK